MSCILIIGYCDPLFRRYTGVSSMKRRRCSVPFHPSSTRFLFLRRVAVMRARRHVIINAAQN